MILYIQIKTKKATGGIKMETSREERIIKEMKEYVLDQLDICEKLEHLIDEYLLLKMLKQQQSYLLEQNMQNEVKDSISLILQKKVLLM